MVTTPYSPPPPHPLSTHFPPLGATLHPPGPTLPPPQPSLPIDTSKEPCLDKAMDTKMWEEWEEKEVLPEEEELSLDRAMDADMWEEWEEKEEQEFKEQRRKTRYRSPLICSSPLTLSSRYSALLSTSSHANSIKKESAKMVQVDGPLDQTST